VTTVLFGALNNKMHTVTTVLFGALNNKMHTVTTVLFGALNNKMHTVTTVLFGAKQRWSVPNVPLPPSTHQPCLSTEMARNVGAHNFEIWWIWFLQLRDSQSLFNPFSVAKLYPCSSVIYQCCDFYSIRKFTIHSEGKNYQLCREENRSFVSLEERKWAVSLLDPLYHFTINFHIMLPYSVLYVFQICWL
jgi:hypothetical protein